MHIAIDEDIRRAWTLPADVYRDEAIFRLARERVFARSWQLVGDRESVPTPEHVHPCTLLEGLLDEPLVLTRDADRRVHCLSNVCTHRGNLVVSASGPSRGLRCRYHGRKFDLSGRFASMQEFEGVENFPSSKDDLPRVPFGVWRDFLFASTDPLFALSELTGPIDARVSWLPFEHARSAPSRSRDYLVHANWALYVDNYLEGFHVPYVHPELATSIDLGAYATEVFSYGSVQIAKSSRGAATFTPNEGRGEGVAAYYFWLFPNTMFNLYPWGISVNIVVPLAVDRTEVRFRSYVWDADKLEVGAGGSLDQVEREDEAVVTAVQRGIRSRLYTRGRYSPTQEIGVHHFHRLLARFLSD